MKVNGSKTEKMAMVYIIILVLGKNMTVNGLTEKNKETEFITMHMENNIMANGKKEKKVVKVK